MTNDLLRTPILYHPGQSRLFRIVTDVRAKPVDGSAKVVVSATNNFRGCHAWFERLQHLCERRMQELAPKFTEGWVVS